MNHIFPGRLQNCCTSIDFTMNAPVAVFQMLVKFPNLVNEVSSGTGGANDNAGNAFYNFSRQYVSVKLR